jgi:hypothetical protein
LISQENIEQLKLDLMEFATNIERCEKLLSQMKDQDTITYYTEQLLVLIQNYYLLEDILKKEIPEEQWNFPQLKINQEKPPLPDNVVDFISFKAKKLSARRTI